MSYTHTVMVEMRKLSEERNKQIMEESPLFPEGCCSVFLLYPDKDLTISTSWTTMGQRALTAEHTPQRHVATILSLYS